MADLKLYILLPKKNFSKHNNPWEPMYDKNHGCIVNARSPRGARKIASLNKGDEVREAGTDVWLDPKYTTCKELKVGKTAGLVLRDFIGS